MRAIQLLLVLAAVGGCHSPQRVGVADLEISGVGTASDTAEAVRRLGRADSATYLPVPHDVSEVRDSTRIALDYPGLRLLFERDGELTAFMITAAGAATRRGLRVGDDSARVLRLYGPPQMRGHSIWYYASENAAVNMLVSLRGPSVEHIVLGLR